MSMRNSVSERVREYSPGLAEALEESLFSNQEIADELRGRASDFPKVSNEFFTLLSLARAVEELDEDS